MRKPLLQNTNYYTFLLFEGGVLENLVFYKSTLQALQVWLKILWKLIFGTVVNLQPVILL